jgi:hypothetical protein
VKPFRVSKALAAIVLAAGLLVSACSSDSATPATTVPTTCDDVAALKTDIASLASIDVVSKGTDGVKASVATIQADFDALKTSASTDAKPEVDAFNTALDGLKSSIDALGSAPLTLASAKDVITSAVSTASAGAALVATLQTACK